MCITFETRCILLIFKKNSILHNLYLINITIDYRIVYSVINANTT